MEKRTKQDLSFFERVERMHPYKMILILGLFGSSLIFLFLLISFFVSLSNVEEVNVEVPSIFIISTILIISSSYFINPIRKLFKANAHKALVTTMRYTFLLGVGFAFCQLMGYRELIESGNLFNSGIASSSNSKFDVSTKPFGLVFNIHFLFVKLILFSRFTI